MSELKKHENADADFDLPPSYKKFAEETANKKKIAAAVDIAVHAAAGFVLGMALIAMCRCKGG
jgi:hypothetical protein